MESKIFITHSSKDQKVARTICAALENRGLACWISSRDVKPGQNYQEHIVKAIRAAKIMVLVFTANANNSNEIKKELALASQNNLIVIPVRIEDVTPNEAFAYEFATRQWIDLFDDWENSIAHLVELIAAAIDDHPSGDAAAPSFGKIVTAGATPTTSPASFTQRGASRWAMIFGIAGAVIVAAAIAYEAVTLLQQPSSTPVTVASGSPVQSEPRALTAPAVVAPAAKPPSRACLAPTFPSRDAFVAWSDIEPLDTIRANTDDMIAKLFTCQALTDAQAFDLFAKMSVLVAQAVPDPSCFDGDTGVVRSDNAFHLSFVQRRGRAEANANLQWKTGKALGCVDKDRRGQLFADLSMALVDADRGHN